MGEQHAVSGKGPIFNAVQRIYKKKKTKTKTKRLPLFSLHRWESQSEREKGGRKGDFTGNTTGKPCAQSCPKNKLARQKQWKSVGRTEVTVSLLDRLHCGEPLLCQGLLEGITQIRLNHYYPSAHDCIHYFWDALASSPFQTWKVEAISWKKGDCYSSQNLLLSYVPTTVPVRLVHYIREHLRYRVWFNK